MPDRTRLTFDAPFAPWLRTAWFALCGWALAATAQAQPAVLQGVQGIDQHGRPFQARQLAGRPVLMHFVFTGCGTTCPTQVSELAALHQALPEAQRKKLVLLSVSVDPLADTPAALADFARRRGADRDGWRFLTGKPQTLAPLYERMQVFDARIAPPGPGPGDHRTSLYLYGADGRLLQRFRGVPVDQPRLLAEIGRL
jgi:protein SCO1/2